LDIPYQEATLHGAPTFYEFDLTKAKKLIGFNPQYDIIRMIEDAIAYREGKTIDVLPTK
jgi:nucleoside-diphosphate-sugar epimerase